MMVIRRLWAMALLPVLVSACQHDSAGPREDTCNTTTLPLSGEPEAPTVTAVRIVFQGPYVVVFAAATDPAGTEDLVNVPQQISIFHDNDTCLGSSIILSSTLAESGVEQSFGVALAFNDDPSLYNAMVYAVTWPVGLVFSDAAGHRTVGRVRAPVLR